MKKKNQDLDTLLNKQNNTFSLDSMINQILWDAQIDDEYLDEARESIKVLIGKSREKGIQEERALWKKALKEELKG